MKNERLFVWLGFTAISLIWGSTWLAIKIGLESIPPFLGAGIRFAVASLVLLTIVRIRKLAIPFTRDAKKVYLSLGILSFSAGYALVYWGEQFISSGLCSILFASFPFWVAILSHLMLRNERLDWYKSAGILIGFVGLLIIFAGDLRWSEGNSGVGIAAVVASTIFQAFTLILIKKYGQPVNPFVMNLVGMSIGSIVLLTLGLSTEMNRTLLWNGSAIGSILYLGVVGSVVTFVTYYWLLKRIEAVYLALTSFINPIVAVFLGAVVLGEGLSTAVFAGAAMVLGGILIANGRYFHDKVRASH